ncbi:MAG: HesA/MoeB/ThiF family protein [Chloroflexi bacterium]|nr:HesA/MoeB/ThiF family protein [Chloroflexota bacterium]
MRRLAQAKRDANGQELALLSLGALRQVAQQHRLTLREAELLALDHHVLPMRYERSLGTVGWDGQSKLLRATVAVVGAGGLGGWIVEGLARMGMGRLIIIDSDAVEESNLNRQLLAVEESLGQPKAKMAAARVAAVNAATEVSAHQLWADAENLPRLLAGAQVAVDALDTLPARLQLQRAAAALGIPFVHGAIAGYSGQVMTILPGDPGLFALYGEDAVPQRGIETRLGNPAATPMMVAAWQIHEVVKLIIGKGELLRHRMLLLDAESGTVDEIAIGGA